MDLPRRTAAIRRRSGRFSRTRASRSGPGATRRVPLVARAPRGPQEGQSTPGFAQKSREALSNACPACGVRLRTRRLSSACTTPYKGWHRLHCSVPAAGTVPGGHRNPSGSDRHRSRRLPAHAPRAEGQGCSDATQRWPRPVTGSSGSLAARSTPMPPVRSGRHRHLRLSPTRNRSTTFGRVRGRSTRAGRAESASSSAILRDDVPCPASTRPGPAYYCSVQCAGTARRGRALSAEHRARSAGGPDQAPTPGTSDGRCEQLSAAQRGSQRPHSTPRMRRQHATRTRESPLCMET